MSLTEYEPQMTAAVRSAIQGAAPDATVDWISRRQRQCQDSEGRGRGVDERTQGWALVLPASDSGTDFLDRIAAHWRAEGHEVEETTLIDGAPVVYAVAEDGMRMSAGTAGPAEGGGTYADIGATSPCMDPTRSDIRDFNPDAPPPEPHDARQL